MNAVLGQFAENSRGFVTVGILKPSRGAPMSLL